ncbi:MAG: methyltransferase domain-containing protein [Candidatus Lokiarchaeia archaeon]
MKEGQYWEKRYSSGGNSGAYSIAWKWGVIDRYLPELNHVLDIGCGDLNFWEGRDCEDYVGIDISKTVIEKNRKKRPKWQFFCTSGEKRIDGLKKQIVFCLDVLMHVMDTKSFLKILHNLCHYSTEYIFIHTWKNNIFDNRTRLKRFLHYLMKFDIIKALDMLKNIKVKKPQRHRVTDGKYQYFRNLECYLDIFREYGFELLRIEENPDKFGALYIFRKKIS